MKNQLTDYFARKLGTELIAFVARKSGKKRGSGRIDLSATDDGYPLYKKAGFKDKEHRYRDMRYTF